MLLAANLNRPYFSCMPRRGRSSLSDQHVFFVTTTIRRHEPILSSPKVLSGLRDILKTVVTKHQARLYGYVFMSNHIHLLVGVAKGGKELSAFMRELKSYSSRTLFPDRGSVWMDRFDDVAIYTEEQFRIKLNYIHNNPVKAGLIGSPEGYQYSSARAWLNGAKDDLVTTSVP